MLGLAGIISNGIAGNVARKRPAVRGQLALVGRVGPFREGFDDQIAFQAGLDLLGIGLQDDLRAVANRSDALDGDAVGGVAQFEVDLGEERVGGDTDLDSRRAARGDSDRGRAEHSDRHPRREATNHGDLHFFAGHEMPVGERLHHVFRRHGRMDHHSALDRRAAFQVQGVRFLAECRRHCQRELDLVLLGRDTAAAEPETFRRVLQRDGNVIGEPVFAERVDGDRHVPAAARVEAGRHDPQLEIRPRRAEAQAIGIVRAALVLGIADVNEVRAVRRAAWQQRYESAWCVFRPEPLSS